MSEHSIRSVYSEEAVFILINIVDSIGGQYLYTCHYFFNHFWTLYSSLDHQEKWHIKTVGSRILNLVLIHAKRPEKIYLQRVGSTKPAHMWRGIYG